MTGCTVEQQSPHLNVHSASIGGRCAAQHAHCGRVQALCDGATFALLDRSRPETVTLPRQGCRQLDVVVHAMGRDSGGTKFDLKGLVHGTVTLDGERWHSL